MCFTYLYTEFKHIMSKHRGGPKKFSLSAEGGAKKFSPRDEGGPKKFWWTILKDYVNVTYVKIKGFGVKIKGK